MFVGSKLTGFDKLHIKCLMNQEWSLELGIKWLHHLWIIHLLMLMLLLLLLNNNSNLKTFHSIASSQAHKSQSGECWQIEIEQKVEKFIPF